MCSECARTEADCLHGGTLVKGCRCQCSDGWGGDECESCVKYGLDPDLQPDKPPYHPGTPYHGAPSP